MAFFKKFALRKYFSAVAAGDVPKLLEIIDRGGEMDYVDVHDTDGRTALHMAGNGQMVEAILRSNLDKIETRDVKGATPMIWAAFNGRLNSMESLIERRANVDARDENGFSAMHLAAA